MSRPNFDPQSDRTQRLNDEVAHLNHRVGQFIDGMTLFWAQQDETNCQPIGPQQQRAIEFTTLGDLLFGTTDQEQEASEPEAMDAINISDDTVRHLRLRQLMNRARGAAREQELADEGQSSE